VVGDDRLVASHHPLLVYESPERERQRTEAWITDALAHGEKVLVKHWFSARAQRWALDELTGAAMTARQRGQLEIIDAEQCHTDTGGDPQALFEWHVAQVQRAREQGYPGVSMTADGTALHVIVPDAEQLVSHERDLDRLTAEAGVRALCRYDRRIERPALLTQLAGVHYHSVHDAIWSTEERIGRLVVRGEIGISNAERFAAVLHAAVADSLRIVDLAEVRFMSVAASAALARVAEWLREHDDQLVLVNVSPVVMRMFSALDFVARAGAEVIAANK
jgi:anti-anti-sigma factor